MISGTCVLAHEDGRFREFPFASSLMSTVAALPFLLFSLSADTLTQSVDVSKSTWATDCLHGRRSPSPQQWLARCTSSVDRAAGAWDFIAIDTVSYKVYRFAAGYQGIFLCGTCPRTEDVSDVAYSNRSGGTATSKKE